MCDTTSSPAHTTTSPSSPRKLRQSIARSNSAMDDFLSSLSSSSANSCENIDTSPAMKEMREELVECGQDHCLAHVNNLDNSEKVKLLKDLASIDFKRLDAFFNKAMAAASASPEESTLDNRMQPIAKEFVGDATAFPPTKDMEAWKAEGLKAISQGEVAIVLLAGGQGTRLGSKDPKGMYPLNLPSGKTLYHLQASRILKLQKLAAETYGVPERPIMWYIMTSDATRKVTTDFFVSKGYFGLRKDQIVFFEQCTLPCLTKEGKVIMKDKCTVARAPDGNGGLYRAISNSGVLENMKSNKIQSVHVYCVDNVLVKVGDPVFIGFCRSKNAPAGNLVCPKRDPHEKVGVTCKVDGIFKVVEYSEISTSAAEQQNADGSLTFNAGNICNHYFDFEFLKKICTDEAEAKLTFHIANKKIPFISEKGEIITPTAPNGIKLEKFVFDVFMFAEQLAILEVARSHNFAPLKNAPSAPKDNVNTCREALFSLHRKYALSAGAKLTNDSVELSDNSDSSQYEFEIDAAISYAGEGLHNLVNGAVFSCPMYLSNREEIESSKKRQKMK